MALDIIKVNMQVKSMISSHLIVSMDKLLIDIQVKLLQLVMEVTRKSIMQFYPKDKGSLIENINNSSQRTRAH